MLTNEAPQRKGTGPQCVRLFLCLATWAIWARNLAITQVARGPVLPARLLPTGRERSRLISLITQLRSRLAAALALFTRTTAAVPRRPPSRPSGEAPPGLPEQAVVTDARP
jgi:hypothetical protein